MHFCGDTASRHPAVRQHSAGGARAGGQWPPEVGAAANVGACADAGLWRLIALAPAALECLQRKRVSAHYDFDVWNVEWTQ